MPRSVGGGGESGKEPVALLPPTQAKQKQPARGGHRDWAILFSHSLRLAKNSCKVTEVRTAAASGGRAEGAGEAMRGRREHSRLLEMGHYVDRNIPDKGINTLH